jgi:hypothetical protein
MRLATGNPGGNNVACAYFPKMAIALEPTLKLKVSTASAEAS